MPQLYVTRRGEVLDWICARHYGGDPAPGVVEAVLDANRGLAARGPHLPEGLVITLPDTPASAAPATAQPARIWD